MIHGLSHDWTGRGWALPLAALAQGPLVFRFVLVASRLF